ncbi:MAG: winged helix-turn-helix domain-containing protein [Methanotrichaceae archaeon]
MNRRRSKEQISFKILEVCRGDGAAKTRIVYACNLNFKVTNHYLEGLVSSGFLEIVNGPVILYKTTNKGLRFLERLRPIEAIIAAGES